MKQCDLDRAKRTKSRGGTNCVLTENPAHLVRCKRTGDNSN